MNYTPGALQIITAIKQTIQITGRKEHTNSCLNKFSTFSAHSLPKALNVNRKFGTPKRKLDVSIVLNNKTSLVSSSHLNIVLHIGTFSFVN